MSNSVQEQTLATVFARYDRRVMNNIHRADYVECLVATLLGPAWTLPWTSGYERPAQRCNDGLFDAFAFAAILGDLKILIGADLLDADEHVASPSLTPHILMRSSLIFQRQIE